jgi:prepilin-type N-terminal cleavage/methylation domain-containing protein
MHHRFSRPGASGFTLVEILVAMAVLALLVALLGQLFINVTAASSISSNHMESDARVRLLFERMAADFSHIVKRADVDCFIKAPSYTEFSSPSGTITSTTNPPSGAFNDQLAFFSEVAGYSDITGVQQNSVSLVAYRVNNTGTAPCIERLGKALAWSGGASGIFPVPFLAGTGNGTQIATIWPQAALTPATSSNTDPAYDADFETIVPNAFRFEYYELHNGTLSATPWTGATGHTTLNGFVDVAAIGVVVAVTDHKSTPLVSTTSLENLAKQLPTFTASGVTTVGGLQQYWQNTVTASSLPSAVKDGIRVYEQLFSIDNPSQ